ncbi:MAG: 23S rRNA (adenine(2503)-C(2))-methyltransferase RlmN [Flavobacteriales bacterium]
MAYEQPDIRSISDDELIALLESWGEKKFRAKQVCEWLWQKRVKSFNEMSNLSAELRKKLSEHFTFHQITIADQQVSSDRTIKCAFKLHDGKVVEGVLIPTAHRMTACISSQVGCSLTCAFCATGKLERLRNLESYEMVDQVDLLNQLAVKNYSIPLSNIVYMGMGEPLLNYKNVMESVHRITSPDGMGMSAQRITISTAGIAKMIKKLGDDGARFNLALSLHAANDEKRSTIMPINDSNSLEALTEALQYFVEKTGTRPTFEYIIFDGFNDTIEDARELAHFCRNFPCKINIIEYNTIDGGEYHQASAENVQAFASYIESRNLIVNVRRSRGKDIDAACGQLANKNKAAV